MVTVLYGWTAGLMAFVGSRAKMSVMSETDMVSTWSLLAISSLLASVTLDLSQYALDIVKGLASEYPDPSPAPRMAPWVLVVLVPIIIENGEGNSSG